MTTEINTVYAKIAAVMADIGAIKADGKHQQGFRYRTADHVFAVIQKSMIKHGLIVLSDANQVEHRDDGQSIINYTFTFVDPDTGHSRACAWIGGSVHTYFKYNKDGVLYARTINDKAINQSATNALKYFLLKTFLVSDQDPEIDSEQQEETPVPTTTPQPWANAKNLDFLYTAAQKQFPSISKPEFLMAAGIDKWTDYDAWAQTYPTGQDASNAIMRALTSTPPPSTNGNGHKSAFAKKTDIDVTEEIKEIAQQKMLDDGDPVTPPKHLSEVDF